MSWLQCTFQSVQQGLEKQQQYREKETDLYRQLQEISQRRQDACRRNWELLKDFNSVERELSLLAAKTQVIKKKRDKYKKDLNKFLSIHSYHGARSPFTSYGNHKCIGINGYFSTPCLGSYCHNRDGSEPLSCCCVVCPHFSEHFGGPFTNGHVTGQALNLLVPDECHLRKRWRFKNATSCVKGYDHDQHPFARFQDLKKGSKINTMETISRRCNTQYHSRQPHQHKAKRSLRNSANENNQIKQNKTIMGKYSEAEQKFPHLELISDQQQVSSDSSSECQQIRCSASSRVNMCLLKHPHLYGPLTDNMYKETRNPTVLQSFQQVNKEEKTDIASSSLEEHKGEHSKQQTSCALNRGKRGEVLFDPYTKSVDVTDLCHYKEKKVKCCQRVKNDKISGRNDKCKLNKSMRHTKKREVDEESKIITDKHNIDTFKNCPEKQQNKDIRYCKDDTNLDKSALIGWKTEIAERSHNQFLSQDQMLYSNTESPLPTSNSETDIKNNGTDHQSKYFNDKGDFVKTGANCKEYDTLKQDASVIKSRGKNLFLETEAKETDLSEEDNSEEEIYRMDVVKIKTPSQAICKENIFYSSDQKKKDLEDDLESSDEEEKDLQIGGVMRKEGQNTGHYWNKIEKYKNISEEDSGEEKISGMDSEEEEISGMDKLKIEALKPSLMGNGIDSVGKKEIYFSRDKKDMKDEAEISDEEESDLQIVQNEKQNTNHPCNKEETNKEGIETSSEDELERDCEYKLDEIKHSEENSDGIVRVKEVKPKNNNKQDETSEEEEEMAVSLYGKKRSEEEEFGSKEVVNRCKSHTREATGKREWSCEKENSFNHDSNNEEEGSDISAEDLEEVSHSEEHSCSEEHSRSEDDSVRERSISENEDESMTNIRDKKEDVSKSNTKDGAKEYDNTVLRTLHDDVGDILTQDNSNDIKR